MKQGNDDVVLSVWHWFSTIADLVVADRQTHHHLRVRLPNPSPDGGLLLLRLFLLN
jgi:hypothetical protein